MNFRTSGYLSDQNVRSGLNLVTRDGLATEVMSTLTGGTFLVALAIHLGASNVQVGLLAALPILTNIFQMLAIWLAQKNYNRRTVTVFCNLFARLSLLVIALLPVLFTDGTSLQVMILLLFFHYLFGSVAGASWNSWMKDLVPEKILGSYFSHRGRLTQILNVTLCLFIAFILDHIKTVYPQYEIWAYTVMFLLGGLFGLLGVYLLSRTPEPTPQLMNGSLFRLFMKPVVNNNFRKLLVFHCFWSFSINMVTPFFAVYMMKMIGLPLAYVVGFGIISQLSSIFCIKMWGRYSDRFSNKTIIAITAPLYVFCILLWAFTGSSMHAANIIFLILINLLTGFTTSGINLAINNIGIKLAPKGEAIVFISARNMVVAMISSLAPIAGGLVADLFSSYNFKWIIGNGKYVFNLYHWNILFIIGAVMAFSSLKLLKNINEEGEAAKGKVIALMRINFYQRLKRAMANSALIILILRPALFPGHFKQAVKKHWHRAISSVKNWGDFNMANHNP